MGQRFEMLLLCKRIIYTQPASTLNTCIFTCSGGPPALRDLKRRSSCFRANASVKQHSVCARHQEKPTDRYFIRLFNINIFKINYISNSLYHTFFLTDNNLVKAVIKKVLMNNTKSQDSQVWKQIHFCMFLLSVCSNCYWI